MRVARSWRRAVFRSVLSRKRLIGRQATQGCGEQATDDEVKLAEAVGGYLAWAVTLEQLDGEAWEQPADETRLVTRVWQLRKRPIADFTVEDLRLMLGQRVGVEHVLPRALEVLRGDPSAEGDFYPGDLLGTVARLDEAVWQELPHLHEAALDVVSTGRRALEAVWDARVAEARDRYGAALSRGDVAKRGERALTGELDALSAKLAGSGRQTVG